MEILSILFITFFIVIYSEIKDNPIFIAEGGYPIVLSTTSDDYYYVINEHKGLKIKKESGIVVETNETIRIELNKLYLVDNLNHNNYIIYESNVSNGSLINVINLINYNPFSISNIGLINSPNIEGVQNKGVFVQDDDFAIYGFYNEQLFLSIKSEQTHSSIQIEQINDKLSCKFIVDNIFVCAIAIDNRVELFCLKYQNKEPLTRLENTFFIDDLIEFSIIALYDTTNANVKIICYIKEISFMRCQFLRIEITDGEQIEFNFLGDENIKFDHPLDDFSENNCYFLEFNSEYLFCSAILEVIYCFRINKDSYDTIRYSKIESSGQNSHLTIKSNNDFITLFYMNNYENGVNCYEYYIYLPKCQNKNYTILNSINWNKSENEMAKLSDLFIVKTNNYYFRLIYPSYEY